MVFTASPSAGLAPGKNFRNPNQKKMMPMLIRSSFIP
jgi:hypothetical protein